jgi:hypothetical protein
MEEPPNATQESPTAVVPEPTPRRPVAWWRRLVFGGETDSFPKTDAITCIELILATLGISTRDRVINFPGTMVSVGDFQKALSELTESDLGWKTLTRLYQEEFSRGRTDHQS